VPKPTKKRKLRRAPSKLEVVCAFQIEWRGWQKVLDLQPYTDMYGLSDTERFSEIKRLYKKCVKEKRKCKIVMDRLVREAEERALYFQML
jgi:hypothetical protein